MSKLFRKLWADDAGAIITVEWILFVGIVLMGLIPAFAGLRNLLSSAVIALGDNAYTIATANWFYNNNNVESFGGLGPVSSISGFSVVYEQDPLVRNDNGIAPFNTISIATYNTAANFPAP